MWRTTGNARLKILAWTCARGLVVLLLLSSGLLAVTAYYFVPPHWPKNFGLVDDRYYFGPNAFYLDASLKNGEYPLWNPLVYCGIPFSADPQANACYPFNLIRSFLTPAFNPHATALGMQIITALHLLFGALGVYILARSYRLSMASALAGAFVYMLGPFSIVYGTEFYVFPLVTSWMPWLLWLASRAIRASRWTQAVSYTAWTALFFGFSALGGFPQLSLYAGISLALFVLLNALFDLSWKHPGRLFRQIPTAATKSGLVLVSVAVLGAMIAAVLLLPAYEFGKYSARTESAGLTVNAWPQNLSFGNLLKCLVIFPGNTWLPQGCRAAGIGSLLAVLCAFGHARKRKVWVFAGMYLVLTDCTLGPPFPFGYLLHAVDFLNITVSPWRAGIYTSLPLAMLVAFGVDVASNAPRRWAWRVVRMVILLAAGGTMILLLTQWMHEKPLYHPWMFVVVIPVLTLLVMLLFTCLRRPRLGRVLIAMLIMGEIVAWGSQMLPNYVSQRQGRNSTKDFGSVTQLSQENRRTAVVRPNWHLWKLTSATNGYNPLFVCATRNVLCSPANERNYRILLQEDEVSVKNQRGHLFAKRSFWLARQWVSGALPGKEMLFPAATTVFLKDTPPGTRLPVPELPRDQISTHATSDNVDRIFLGSGDALKKSIKTKADKTTLTLPPLQQQNTHSALCLGYIAEIALDFSPYCTDENGHVYKLKQSRTVPSKGVENILEFPLPDCMTSRITIVWPSNAKDFVRITEAYVLKDRNDEDNHLANLRRKANSVELDVNDLPGPRILAFIDSAYPGWCAWVDGAPVPLLLANDAFKAVVIPAGTHHIRFAYQSTTTYVGLTVSLMALLMVLGTHGALWLRSEKLTL